VEVSVVPSSRSLAPSAPPQRGSAVGAGAIVVAAASWGALGPAMKILPDGATPMTVAAFRIGVGAVGFLPVVARRPQAWRILRGSGTWRWLAVAAAANVVCHLTLVLGLVEAGVAAGDVVHMGLCPLFTALAERALGRGSLTRRWAVTTAVAVGGCVLLVADHGGAAGPHVTLGVILAAVSAVAYSLFTVTSAHVITRGNCSNVVMATVFAGTALGLAPALVIWPVGWITSARGGGVVLVLGLVATTGAYLLYGYGLRQTPSRVASTLVLAEPVTATVVAVGVLGERFGWAGAAGLVAVLAALVATVAAGTAPASDTRAVRRQGRRAARPLRPRGRHVRGQNAQSPLPLSGATIDAEALVVVDLARVETR
jgi:drug/metabolite transporter, DME family